MLAHDLARSIRRAVVNDYDLEVLIIRFKQALNGLHNHALFVVSGHDDRDGWLVVAPRVQSFAPTRANALRESERANHDQTPQTEQDACEKEQMQNSPAR